jgi:hypothetical protein
MFGVSFLYPLFLSSAHSPSRFRFALHLFRRRTEKVVEFPAVRLLHKAPVQQQRRRRLRELILLALRVTALALLALAFARPYFSGRVSALPLPTTVVALDTSLSLLGAGSICARAASGSEGRGHYAGHAQHRARDVRGHGHADGRADHRSRRRGAPRSTRLRPVLAARDFVRRSRGPRTPPAPAAAASSSSPIFSRRDGRPATKVPCPTAFPSKWSKWRRRPGTWP